MKPPRQKWRPPLALVIGGTLAAVLALPVLGIAWFRLAGNILGWLETAQLFAFVAIVATSILAFLLWRLVLRPVWALTSHARAIKAGRAGAPPPQSFGTPEFRDLAESVVQMGDALNARARSLSAYADHVTHELKSPLTALRGAADLLNSDDLGMEDRESLLRTIQASATRMEHLLNDMRAHAAARLDSQSGATTLAAALVNADCPQGLDILTEGSGQVPMSEQDLARVLTQIARNAKEHGATRLVCEVKAGELLLTDNGPGIMAGDRARVFDPFFTTRRDSGGTGMGLSIAQSLIEASGGRITLTDHAPGAQFRIFWR